MQDLQWHKICTNDALECLYGNILRQMTIEELSSNSSERPKCAFHSTKLLELLKKWRKTFPVKSENC